MLGNPSRNVRKDHQKWSILLSQPGISGIASVIPTGLAHLKGLLPADSNNGYSVITWLDSSQGSKHSFELNIDEYKGIWNSLPLE